MAHKWNNSFTHTQKKIQTQKFKLFAFTFTEIIQSMRISAPVNPLNTQNQKFLKIGNFNVNNSFSEKLLGIKFDSKLNFSNHIEDI